MFTEKKPIDLSPYDHPDIYPGPHPSSTFVFFDGQAYRMLEEGGVPIENLTVLEPATDHISGSLSSAATGKGTSLESFLDERGLTPMDDRVPVMAYGSNVCLAQLRYKFNLNRELKDAYIAVRAVISDSDIVYGAFLAPYGSVPAIIAPVKGAEVEVWISFVERKQLELIIRTEVGYEWRRHTGGKVKAVTGEVFEDVYCFYHPSALEENGTFYRFKDIAGESPLPSVWQAEMLNYLKTKMKWGGTREEYIHKLRWDWRFKQEVEHVLKSWSKQINHPDWTRDDTVLSIKQTTREFR